VYKLAKQRTKETGELHVPWNLRVIHWLENAQKGAYTWPDMPDEQIPLICPHKEVLATSERGTKTSFSFNLFANK